MNLETLIAEAGGGLSAVIIALLAGSVAVLYRENQRQSTLNREALMENSKAMTELRITIDHLAGSKK